ncbi:MAG: hypothetical protein H0T41_12925 [Rhodobacteraceae bacterium]|nr:hypothetical protein [Paracoccaceae bacterium]
MTDRPAPPRPAKPAPKDGMADRRAAALRANLARRKAQKRARQTGPDALTGPASPVGSQEQG